MLQTGTGKWTYHASDVRHAQIAAREVVPRLTVLLVNTRTPPERPHGVLPALLLDVRASKNEPRPRKERVDGERGLEVGDRGRVTVSRKVVPCERTGSSRRRLVRLCKNRDKHEAGSSVEQRAEARKGIKSAKMKTHPSKLARTSRACRPCRPCPQSCLRACT